MNGVSVVIKAYNEAGKIDEAIRSALRAGLEVRPLPLEVVVADGLSDDSTAQRAARWGRHAPVRVVQLVHRRDRNCGAGVELGFAASRGPWVLLMDGDMVLQPGFLPKALAFLHDHPRCAGVAGELQDEALRNGFDRIRQRKALNSTPGIQPWLNGGGLYRRQALLDAGGYAGDERLAAFEEADLGLRLLALGWNLFRLPIPGVVHRGHIEPAPSLLWSRWRAGRFTAAGRLLRLHGRGPGGPAVWKLLAHPLVLPWAWAVVLLASLQWGGLLAVLPVSTLMVHWVWRRDGSEVLTAWLDWHLLLAGIIQGLLLPLRARRRELAFRAVEPS
ncbi:MAG: glycosyltransferase [Burkholderiaceae bacterium]|jgi:GT2 family glycosyltransferase